ncbi:MAG: hypothetical protein AN481_02530 [Aphanizomenon flos-aquae LD13]|jgi:hypothetical protein|uniref:O-antigen polymerase n=1 Tax=Aphanizomenon flos-aquae LD13 TaxID=1710894 RepID=A0A1B7W0Z9_APHFL|nr:hypothetical protein [Aphanizomenon flos-aquae UKL13-PB]OBQ26943.1 MAG: hypothetical protein AN481_02530 [Aphanizomenon flos-aquae LD13]HCQ23441.1 hypothetical protein [Anabaena sp. UBA12330]
MKNLFNDGLLSVIVLELMIGGSGRFLEVGSVTARMLLYILAMIYSLFLFFRGTVINKYYINLTILFFILSLFSSLVGLFNHADLSLIFEDFKQILYFPMIIFFSIFINSYTQVVKVSYLIKLSAVVLLASYLSVLLALQLGIIPFNVLYDFLSDSDQFFFRGETGFFYKGFIMLCIAVFFFVLEKPILSKIMCGFMFIGIVLTFTRGFIYSTILVLAAYLAYFNLKTKNLLNIILLIILPSVIAPSFLSWFLETLGDKGESDSVRLENIQQVLDGVDNTSFFIGHGLGVGVEIRPVHMEVSYLEIFHKQGVLGLIFWICILLILIMKFTSACKNGNNLIATSFFLSSIFVFIQSLTNPYINNPIGMSIIIISIVCLDVLSKYSNSEETNENQHLHGHI